MNGGRAVLAAVFSGGLPSANRRRNTRIDLPVSFDRGIPLPWSWMDVGGRVDRGSAPLGRGPEPTAGRTALGRCRAVAAWQPDLDVRVGYSVVPFRSDQLLLQLSLLGEDDVAVPGAPFYLHGSPPRDADGPELRSTAAGPIYGVHIAGPVVWRGVGRTLDRVFLKRAFRTTGTRGRAVTAARRSVAGRAAARPLPFRRCILAFFHTAAS